MVHVLMTLDTEFSAKSTVDDTVIQEIANGNMNAFHRLYENISRSVYGFALSITKNTYDAEDVLQDTFLTIYRKAVDYQLHEKPMAWIFTIARNSALMKLRTPKKEIGLEESQVENSIAFSKIEEAEAKIMLQAFLDMLNDEERQIVMLHTVSGLKNREIAALMGIPLNTVLSKYHRAIKKLKNSMKEEFVK